MNNTLYAVDGELYWNGTELGLTPSNNIWSGGSMSESMVQRGIEGEWYRINMSSSGQYQSALNVSDNYLYTSSDYGVTWVQNASSSGLAIVGMSSSGEYQTARSYSDNYTYTSSDYGATWTQVASTSYLVPFSLSSSGQHQTAYGHVDGYIYISSDYGATWEQTEAQGGWRDSIMSSSGQYQTASNLSSNELLYTSSDYGATWTQVASTSEIIPGEMSDSGQYQTAYNEYNGYIYISSNYGETWKVVGIKEDWNGVAMSSSGQYQTAFISSSERHLYTSSDYGETWKAVGALGDWTSAVMSSSGKYQVANNENDGHFYASSDYGETWTQIGIEGDWKQIAISSDGNFVTGVQYGGYIYTFSQNAYTMNTIGIGTTATENGLTVGGGIGIVNGIPATTTNALYAIDGDLYWNGGLLNIEISPIDTFLLSEEGGIYIGNTRVSENQWGLKRIGKHWIKNESLNGMVAGVSVSSNAKYQNVIFELNQESGAEILSSSDYGTTWTHTATTSDLFSIINMSANGKYRMIGQEAGTYGQVRISSDYGETWTSVGTSSIWIDSAMSADGKYQIVAGVKIQMSSDYGATWEIVENDNPEWYGVTMSADGTYISVSGAGTLNSSDRGETWNYVSGAILGVEMSDDGKYRIGNKYNDFVQISSDYGANWESTDVVVNGNTPLFTAISPDGRIQLTSPTSTALYISKDYGTTWEENIFNGDIARIDMSSDGKFIFVGTENGLYVSIADSYIYGNIGIGTSTPNSALTVVGTSTFNGNILLATGNQNTYPMRMLVLSTQNHLATEIYTLLQHSKAQALESLWRAKYFH
jgi:hypothetical protein